MQASGALRAKRRDPAHRARNRLISLVGFGLILAILVIYGRIATSQQAAITPPPGLHIVSAERDGIAGTARVYQDVVLNLSNGHARPIHIQWVALLPSRLLRSQGLSLHGTVRSARWTAGKVTTLRQARWKHGARVELGWTLPPDVGFTVQGRVFGAAAHPTATKAQRSASLLSALSIRYVSAGHPHQAIVPMPSVRP